MFFSEDKNGDTDGSGTTDVGNATSGTADEGTATESGGKADDCQDRATTFDVEESVGICDSFASGILPNGTIEVRSSENVCGSPSYITTSGGLLKLLLHDTEVCVNSVRTVDSPIRKTINGRSTSVRFFKNFGVNEANASMGFAYFNNDFKIAIELGSEGFHVFLSKNAEPPDILHSVFVPIAANANGNIESNLQFWRIRESDGGVYVESSARDQAWKEQFKYDWIGQLERYPELCEFFTLPATLELYVSGINTSSTNAQFDDYNCGN